MPIDRERKSPAHGRVLEQWMASIPPEGGVIPTASKLLMDAEPAIAAGTGDILAVPASSCIHIAAQQFGHAASVIPPGKLQDDSFDFRPASKIFRIGFELHHRLGHGAHV